MLISLTPAALAENGALNGSGTADDPYVIADAADLIKFRDTVSSEDSSALCARLGADIELTDNWEPFSSKSGYPTTAYAGTFDGNGHKISGVNVNTTAPNAGFFGVINGAVIENLRLEGNISSSNNYVGGIVGKIQQGTVTNCSFAGSVTTTKSGANAGGIAGASGNTAKQTAAISGCVNTASVSGGIVGGIVGAPKYTAIADCYNTGAISGTSRCGGIVGNLQSKSTVKNCYSIGTLNGDGTKGDICGFNGVSIENCYYTTAANGAGAGSATNCEQFTSADGLCQKLGSAFVEDTNSINGGYPILAWQSGKAPEPAEPSVKISGISTLKMNNSGSDVFTELTAAAENIDGEVKFEWSVSEGEDVIRLEKPENADESGSKIYVYAKAPGKAHVTVATADGAYSDSIDISVLPFITTVEIDGITAVGKTVKAKVNVLGGAEYDYENFPALKYQWKYLTEEDYSAGNTGYSSYKTADGATEREFTVPADLEHDYLSFEVSFDGEKKNPSSPSKIGSAEDGYAAEDASNLEIDTSDVKAEKYITLPSKGKNGSDISWSSDNENIISAESGKVTLPEKGIETVKLTATVKYSENSAQKIRNFTIKVYSAEEAEREKNDKLLQLKKIIEELDCRSLTPVYGEDTNVVDMLKAKLDRSDVSVSIAKVEEVYDGAKISDDGAIEYYYKNPNEETFIHFGKFNVTFTLALDEASTELVVPVTVYHDADKVKEVMRSEILSKTTLSADGKITAEEDLILPKIADGKKWTLISWTSSNEDVLRISNENQQTANTLFEPYVGKVNRGIKDENVSLTAVYTYQFTNDVTGTEKPITLIQSYEVTVKALGKEEIEAKRAELAAKLDAGFEKAGLRDAVSGELLPDVSGVYTAENDILFPTTKDFGVDGKYTPVNITSDNNDVIFTYDVNNAARAEVIRPAPGKNDAVARVTVSLSENGTGIYAEKTFKIRVRALTEEEITAEKALMEKVKASYFDGIKGSNFSSGDISANLTPFTEVYEDNGSLVWVRTDDSMSNHGIVPTPLDGWEELEAWRLFKSSNPNVITHENLLVTMQKNAKSVTVSSALSSETLGRYGKLYLSNPKKYADYKELEDLYYQTVSAELVVRGKTTGRYNSPVAVEETIDVSFTLTGPEGTWIADTKLNDLAETATAYDVFKKVLSDNKYTYESKGTGYGIYVTSVTTPDGEKVAELSYGKNSGWMYKMNGYMAEVAMTKCGLNDGDKIEFFFSKDYTKEDYSQPGDNKNSYSGGGSSTKNDAASDTDKTPEDKTENPTDNTNIKSFGDVKGHWAEKEIDEVCRKGLLKGTDDSHFEPEAQLTRAMFVTILHRMENEPDSSTAKFGDVKDGEWYSKAVAWASKNGIVNGVSDTEFAPDDIITREQLAVMMYRYANYKKYDTNVGENTNILSYSDFDSISDYAFAALQWTAGSGIMSGKSAETLNPQDNATRAEIAVIILRFINSIK